MHALRHTSLQRYNSQSALAGKRSGCLLRRYMSILQVAGVYHVMTESAFHLSKADKNKNNRIWQSHE